MAGDVISLQSANDRYQVLHSLLTSRNQRHRRGQFLVQGVRPITVALQSGWPLEAVLWSEGRRRSRWAQEVIEVAPAAQRYELSPDLIAPLADKDDGTEVLLVARMPTRSLADVNVGPDSLLCGLDRIQSPGNLGSIVRSADAFGVQAVVLLGHGADPYDPRAVRSSTGSIFAVPVIPVGGVPELAAWLDAIPPAVAWRVIGAEESGPGLEPDQLRPPGILLLGSEGRGLSRAARSLCHELCSIPMTGTASSLNIASAASILLYEAARSRRFGRSPTQGEFPRPTVV